MTTNPANTNAFGSDDPGMAHIDLELRSLAAALDALGESERAASTTGLEARIAQMSLAALHGVEPMVEQMDVIGMEDREAAAPDLEASVFGESVPALHAAPPVLRHTGQNERPADRHIRQARPAWWANQYVRLAAAVLLVAGVGIAVRTAITPVQQPPSIPVASSVARDLDLLFATIESPGTTGDSSDSGTPSDPDELTRFLIEGASS